MPHSVLWCCIRNLLSRPIPRLRNTSAICRRRSTYRERTTAKRQRAASAKAHISTTVYIGALTTQSLIAYEPQRECPPPNSRHGMAPRAEEQVLRLPGSTCPPSHERIVPCLLIGVRMPLPRRRPRHGGVAAQVARSGRASSSIRAVQARTSCRRRKRSLHAELTQTRAREARLSERALRGTDKRSVGLLTQHCETDAPAPRTRALAKLTVHAHSRT